MAAANIDPREVAKFEALASRWWDADGDLRTLHDINPVRLGFIAARVALAGKQVIDVGCGGGILAEAMAEHGAGVTGIDASDGAIRIAKLHQARSRSQVRYRVAVPEALVAEEPGSYDVVTCMEIVEHVPYPERLVEACARLVRPGGHVFLSTINRTPAAYVLAVIAAEYVLRLLPQGTHDYGRFIRPSELAAWLRDAGLTLATLKGLWYNPGTRRARLQDQVTVNYLVHATAP
jgi:2-polyprenyl-6-hydroxyphenyl methylase/3-demethylubiquinone-9 3-methyltransferase